jgi:hypothetical protein
MEIAAKATIKLMKRFRILALLPWAICFCEHSGTGRLPITGVSRIANGEGCLAQDSPAGGNLNRIASAHNASTQICRWDPIFTSTEEWAFKLNAHEMVILACARHRLTITLDPLAHFINSPRAVILPKRFLRQADRED